MWLTVPFALCCASFVAGFTLAGRSYYRLGAERGARFSAFYLGSLASGCSVETAQQYAAERSGVLLPPDVIPSRDL